jgi:hypothetical protein
VSLGASCAPEFASITETAAQSMAADQTACIEECGSCSLFGETSARAFINQAFQVMCGNSQPQMACTPSTRSGPSPG